MVHRYWYNRADCETIRTQAYRQILSVYEAMIKPDSDSVETQPATTVDENEEDSLAGYLMDSEYENTSQNPESLKLDIAKEISQLCTIAEKNGGTKMSTSAFWLLHSTELPNLTKLVLRLANIPSSSAYIERYFSLCGAICTQRKSKMLPEQISTHAMIKTNMKLLVSLNKPANAKKQA